MRKHTNKWAALAMAGALAVSNLSMVVTPLTSIVVSAATNNLGTGTFGTVGDVNIAPIVGRDFDSGFLSDYTAGTNGALTAAKYDKTKWSVVSTNPAGHQAAFTLDASGSSVKTDGADDSKAVIQNLKIKADGSKTASFSNGDKLDVVCKYDDGIYDMDVTFHVTFGNNVTASQDDMTRLVFAKANATTGKLEKVTKYEVPVTTATGQVVTLGVQDSAISAITNSGYVIATDPTGGTASTKFIWSTGDSSIISLQSGATPFAPVFNFVKAGSTTITLTAEIYDNSNPNVKLATKTYTVDVELKAGIAAVTTYQVDANGVTNVSATATLTEAVPSTKFKAVAYSKNATSNISGFDPAQKFVFVSADPSLVEVEANGDDGAIIKGVGNTKTATPVNVYALSTQGETYKAYEKATSDAKKLDVIEKALAATPAATDVTFIAIDVTGAKRSLVFTENSKVMTSKSLDIIVGKEDSTVTVATNDGNVVGGTTPGADTIVWAVESADKTVATAEVDATTGVITIKGIKAGTTEIKVKGTYKGSTENVVLEDSLTINVIDPDEEAAKDAEATQKAAEEKKAAEDKATAAEQAKTAAEKKAADAATAQKTAEDKATAAESKATAAEAKAAEAEKKAAAAEEANKLAKALTTNAGKTKKVSGTSFTTDADGGKSVAVKAAKNAKSVSIGKTVKIAGNTYKVRQIGAKAFTGKKIRTITVDAKNIKTVDPNAFKGTKATKLQVKNASKATKKQFKAALKVKKIKTVTGVK